MKQLPMTTSYSCVSGRAFLAVLKAKKYNRAMKILSLFSGVGVLDYAFSAAGFDVVCSVSGDGTVSPTHKANHEHPLLVTPIDLCDPKKMPRAEGIIGGPPLADFEPKRALSSAKPFGRLVLGYLDFVTCMQPLFIFFWSPPQTLQTRCARGHKAFLKALDDLGYELVIDKLNALDYFVPQEREDLYVTGFRRDLERVNFRYPAPNPFRQSILTGIYDLRDNAVLRGLAEPSLNAHEHPANFRLPLPGPENYRGWTDPSLRLGPGLNEIPLHPQTCDRKWAGEGKKVKWGPGRIFTVREAARLQSFPDDFEFVYDKIEDGYRFVCDAVPLRPAIEIARRILSVFD